VCSSDLPLLDKVVSKVPRGEFLAQHGLPPGKTIIALLPGSRVAEINHLLPVMLRSAELIQRSLPDTRFIIAKSPYVPLETYTRYTKNSTAEAKLIENRTYDCLNAADFCLVCSGTATLETAILQKPFFILYKMNPLNYMLYRPQVKVPYIGIVNLIAGKKIVPEFIQSDARPERIASAVTAILADPKAIATMLSELAAVKSQLGEKGASGRAAQIIADSFLK
jgi:lipid-A-disaccharide synthase